MQGQELRDEGSNLVNFSLVQKHNELEICGVQNNLRESLISSFRLCAKKIWYCLGESLQES